MESFGERILRVSQLGCVSFVAIYKHEVIDFLLEGYAQCIVCLDCFYCVMWGCWIWNEAAAWSNSIETRSNRGLYSKKDEVALKMKYETWENCEGRGDKLRLETVFWRHCISCSYKQNNDICWPCIYSKIFSTGFSNLCLKLVLEFGFVWKLFDHYSLVLSSLDCCALFEVSAEFT